MIRTIAWTTIALLVIGTLAATSVPAQTAADEVEFHYVLEDAQFDEGAQCTTGWDTNLDGPCDIWTFEAGNTADTFVFRFTQGTMNYGPAAATSELNPRFAFEDPEGNQYRAHVAINADGDVRTVSFGSDQGPPPDGIEWVVDQDAGTITASFPLDSLEGVGPGATLTVLEISTAWALEGALFWTNQDNIPDAPEVEIQSSGPAIVEETIEGDELAANVTIDEPTNATYVYHWNHTVTGDVQVTYSAELTNGSVQFTIIDAANTTLVDATVTGSVDDSFVLEDVAPGNWTISTAFVNATGAFSLDIVPYTPPEPTLEPDADGPVGNETAPAGNTTSFNETDDGLGIPGFEAPLLAAGVSLVAILAMRRRESE